MVGVLSRGEGCDAFDCTDTTKRGKEKRKKGERRVRRWFERYGYDLDDPTRLEARKLDTN